MKFGLTRPQLHREFTYLRLWVRALLTSMGSTIALHRKVIILVTGSALYLSVLILAAVQFSSGEHSVVAAPTTPASAVSRPSVPAPVAPPAPIPGPPNPPKPSAPPEQRHVVRAGETLASIALHYGVPLEQIAAGNGINNHRRIHAGQQLLIPVCPPEMTVIAAGTTLSYYARLFGVTVAQLLKLNPNIVNPDRIRAGSGLRVRQP